MKCKVCQAEMVASKIGHLCFECGHSNAAKPKKSGPKSKTADGPALKLGQPKKGLHRISELAQPVSYLACKAADKDKGEMRVGRVEALLPHLRFRRTKRLAAITVIGLGIIIGAYAVVALRANQQALSVLSSRRDAQVSANITLKADDFLRAIATDVDFNGEITRSNGVPQVQGKYGGTIFGRSYQGDGVLSDGRLFFKLAGRELPVVHYRQSQFYYHITPEWHSLKLDQSAFDDYCETRDDSTKTAEVLDLYRSFRAVKAKPSPWVNQFSSLEGNRATYVAGSFDSAAIRNVFGSLTQAFPEGCSINTIGLTAEDLKQLTTKYEIWTADEASRIKISLLDPSLGIRLVTDITLRDVREPVVIRLPLNAFDMGSLGEQYDAILKRDAMRRADIVALQRALDGYYKANSNRYPASLSRLVPAYLNALPLDPSNSQPYPYATSNSRRNYSVTITLEQPHAGNIVVSGP